MTRLQPPVSPAAGFSPALIFGAFLLPTILGYLFSRWHYQLGSGLGWKTSQFFFSYQELGFVKRGLIGSLLHPFDSLLRGEALLIQSAVLLLLFLGVFTVMFRRAGQGLEAPDRRWLLALCALSPALFLHFGLDLGRFDILGLLVALGSIWALQRGHWSLAGLGSAVALLAHEAYLVINFPLVLAFALTLHRSGTRAWLDWAGLILPSLAVAAVIAGFGRYEPGLDALTRHFAGDLRYLAAAGGQVDKDAIAVITRTTGENLDYVAWMFWKAKAYIHLPAIIIWGLIMTLYFRAFHRVNGLRPGILFYAVFTPVLLSAIACDHYRWVALAATNMFLVILLETARLAGHGSRVVMPRGGMAWLLIASTVCGPIGHAKSFPLIFSVVKFLLTGESSS